MTSYDDDLDRRLTARLDERADSRAPEGLSEAITERVTGTKQRPAWATTERWISMETRAQFGAVPRAVIVLATLALLTALAAGAIVIGANNPPRLPPPFGPADNGRIAFVLEGDIWTVDPESGDRRQLSSGPAADFSPVWSRDGTRLAFWSGPGEGPWELIVTDAQGREGVVTASSAGEPFAKPTWSADSSEIMFSATVPSLSADPCPSCGSRLFVAQADGSGSAMVGDADLDARGPELSPDGSTVAFGGGVAASEALYLMDWDGLDIRRLAGVDRPGGWAFAKQSWSPDGERLVTQDGAGSQRLWLLRPDGSGASVVGTPGEAWWPRYAPDGSAILYATGSGSAFVPPADVVADLVWVHANVEAWSPDGTQLVGVRAGEILLVDRAGEDVAVLGPADDDDLDWQRVAQ